jgi:hypothetical protein
VNNLQKTMQPPIYPEDRLNNRHHGPPENHARWVDVEVASLLHNRDCASVLADGCGHADIEICSGNWPVLQLDTPFTPGLEALGDQLAVAEALGTVVATPPNHNKGRRGRLAKLKVKILGGGLMTI